MSGRAAIVGALVSSLALAACGATGQRATARGPASSAAVPASTLPGPASTSLPTPTSTTSTPANTPPPRPILPATAAAVAPPATPPPAPACLPNLAGRLESTGTSNQLITVDAVVPTTTFVTVSLWQRAGRCWTVAAGPWPGRIGTSGFSDHHREGDGTTPTGAYGIGPVMYGNAPNPGVRYSYHDLVCGDWWDGDPASATYNTFQHLPCLATPPFAGNSEALWRQPQAYASFAVVDYNTNRVPGAGSAIFVHADTGVPTAGCVALPVDDLDQLLRWLNASNSPLIVMGPDSEINRF